jgi:hypothetical protein
VILPARFLHLALLPAIVLAQVRVDGALGEFRSQEDVLYLRSAQQVKRLFPGFEGMLTDLYWLRTVQYFGRQRLFSKQKSYALLRPLVEITTDLDPRFELAYRYGAIFLSEPWPNGPGKPREGVEVLEKGIRALPHSWRLRFDLACILFMFLEDAPRASRVLTDSARLPGAPFWMESLAARFMMKDNRAAARELWRRQLEQGFGFMKENAAYHLQILDALDLRDALGRLVERFAQAHGRRPRSLQELVGAGLLRGVPGDPAGVPFDYDPETGKVRVSARSKLYKPYD